MKIKFIQISCIEGKKLDLRQSQAVLRYKPDFIFLEYPGTSLKPIVQPVKVSKKIIARYPWTASDNYLWANISRLWKSGVSTRVFAIDGPPDLVTQVTQPRYDYPYNDKNPRKSTNLFWWVRIFLRELFMAKKLGKILKRYQVKNDAVCLIFLEKFHWEHVKFLLSKPAKQKVWEFYFGRFKNLDRKKITELIRKENKILFKYWIYWKTKI